MANIKSRKKRSTKRKYTSKRKQVERKRNILIITACVLLLAIIGALGWMMYSRAQSHEAASRAEMENTDPDRTGAPNFDVQLLTVNEYSRPGIPLEQVNGIAIHYTANPGASAQNNRDYFEGLKDSHVTKASSHFIIGIEGEIIQCIPSSEISYCTNDRNGDTLSIECCHPDETGKFTDATYESVVEMTAWLCVRFGLTTEDVIRHYDVTGKDCPKYYVENPEAWQQMKNDIGDRMEIVKQMQAESETE